MKKSSTKLHDNVNWAFIEYSFISKDIRLQCYAHF